MTFHLAVLETPAHFRRLSNHLPRKRSLLTLVGDCNVHAAVFEQLTGSAEANFVPSPRNRHAHDRLPEWERAEPDVTVFRAGAFAQAIAGRFATGGKAPRALQERKK